MRENYLFSQYRLSDAADGAVEAIKKSIEQIPINELMARDVDELVEELVSSRVIVVPELDTSAITTSHREVELDVSHDRTRHFRGPGPHYIKVTEISFHIPFVGERDVFRLQPSRYSMLRPRGDIAGNELILRVIKTNQNQGADAIKKEFDEELRRVEQELAQLRSDAAPLPEQLRQTAKPLIEHRRAKREQDVKVVEGLGFPQRATRS